MCFRFIDSYLLSIQGHSVGNCVALQETCLVEAFNLKMAIEFKLNKFTYAKNALRDMPPRYEEELDAVTLHNQVTLLQPCILMTG